MLADFGITARHLLQPDGFTPAASRECEGEESQSAAGDSHAFIVKLLASGLVRRQLALFAGRSDQNFATISKILYGPQSAQHMHR